MFYYVGLKASKALLFKEGGQGGTMTSGGYERSIAGGCREKIGPPSVRFAWIGIPALSRGLGSMASEAPSNAMILGHFCEVCLLHQEQPSKIWRNYSNQKHLHLFLSSSTPPQNLVQHLNKAGAIAL